MASQRPYGPTALLGIENVYKVGHYPTDSGFGPLRTILNSGNLGVTLFLGNIPLKLAASAPFSCSKSSPVWTLPTQSPFLKPPSPYPFKANP